MVNTIIMKVLFLSLIPTFEGRYALIAGAAMGLDPLTSFLIATIGVVLLSTMLSLLLPWIDNLLQHLSGKNNLLGRLYTRYLVRVRRKAKPYMDKYGLIGLTLFVAVPLPGSGIWTGSLAGFLLGLDRWRMLAVLLAGGILSNTITLLLLVLGKSITISP